MSVGMPCSCTKHTHKHTHNLTQRYIQEHRLSPMHTHPISHKNNCRHRHTHTQTHAHTHTQTQTHICIYTHTQTCSLLSQLPGHLLHLRRPSMWQQAMQCVFTVSGKKNVPPCILGLLFPHPDAAGCYS